MSPYRSGHQALQWPRPPAKGSENVLGWPSYAPQPNIKKRVSPCPPCELHPAITLQTVVVTLLIKIFVQLFNNTSHSPVESGEGTLGISIRLVASHLSQPIDSEFGNETPHSIFRGSNSHILNNSKATMKDAVIRNLSNTREASTKTPGSTKPGFYQEHISVVLEIQRFSWFLWALHVLRQLLSKSKSSSSQKCFQLQPLRTLCAIGFAL